MQKINFKRINLQKARKIKSKFVLVSSDLTLSSRKIIQNYSNKYQIEHVFRFLKTDLKVHPFWLRKTNRIIAYIFISYLAYLIKSVVDYRIKKSRLNISFLNVLDELENLKLVTLSINDKSYEKISEITSNQEKIFKSLKVKKII